MAVADPEGNYFENSFGENGPSIDYNSETDAFTNQCKEFMGNFVSKMFSSNTISQEEKAQFGVICQHAAARQWFACYVNLKRGDNKCVDEITFFRLVQYFATVLFECHQADDFTPAKTLMNMCFTFCHVFKTGRTSESKEFLHVYLRDQPIWHTLRFWNAAFLDSVHSEKQSPTMSSLMFSPQQVDKKEKIEKKVVKSARVNWNNLTEDDKLDRQEHEKNTMFGQLGTFATNMKAFGLSKSICLEFIEKMSTIGDLNQDQITLLQQNFEQE